MHTSRRSTFAIRTTMLLLGLTVVAGAQKPKHTGPASSTQRTIKSLLRGITLSKSERTSVNATERKYDGQVKDLTKRERTLAKAGTPDAAIIAQIDALRSDERNEVRSELTAVQVMQFNKNAANLGNRKHSN